MKSLRTLLSILPALVALWGTQAFAYDNASVLTPGLLGAEIVHEEKPERTLITNVHVFDGTKDQRIMNANVLIELKGSGLSLTHVLLQFKT